MTQRHLTATIVSILLLLIGGVPLAGWAGEDAPAVSPQTAPASETGNPVGKPFDGDLFVPAPVPMCTIDACWVNGAECSTEDGGIGVCYRPAGRGCGTCL